MGHWQYKTANGMSQPIDTDGLRALLETGQLQPSTAVWSAVTRQWLPLSEAINEVKALGGPQLGRVEAVLDGGYRSGTFGNQRFWARQLDFLWQVTLSQAVVSVVWYALKFREGDGASVNFLAWTEDPTTIILSYIFAIPFALLLDGLVYQGWGTTLGKALCGLQVRNAQGLLLEPKEYWKRNLGVWVQGYGLGILFIAPLTLLWQGWRCLQDKPASYDEEAGYQVYGKAIGPVRVLAYIGMYLAILVLLKMTASLGVGLTVPRAIVTQQSQTSSPTNPALAGWAWVNPVTQKNVVLDPAWRVEAQTDAQGQTSWTFNNDKEPVLVKLYARQWPDTSRESFRTYAAGVKQFYARYCQYSGTESISFGANGLIWQIGGTSLSTPKFAMTIELDQRDEIIWHIIMVATPDDLGQRNVALQFVDELKSSF